MANNKMSVKEEMATEIIADALRQKQLDDKLSSIIGGIIFIVGFAYLIKYLFF